MPLTSPVFSIIIPTYNRAHLIGKTIGSVINQDFKDFEVLVVDDGSNDNTEEVVRQFVDPRVQYYKKNNAGRGAARNFGAARAKGTYVNFLDSDDLLYQHHLTVAYEMTQLKKQPEFFHLAYDFKLEDGTVLTRINDFDESIKGVILFDNKLSCNGIFIRKDIATLFPFEESRVLASSEDWLLWIRLICRYPLHISNEITSSVINHDQRSLRTIAADNVVARDLLLLEKIRQDTSVMTAYGNSFKRFTAMRYTFFMLVFSTQGNRRAVWQWGMRAFQIHPLVLVNKRFLASIKNSIL